MSARALAGRRVLGDARTAPGWELQRRGCARGGGAFEKLVLEIRPPADLAPLDGALAQLTVTIHWS